MASVEITVLNGFGVPDRTPSLCRMTRCGLMWADENVRDISRVSREAR